LVVLQAHTPSQQHNTTSVNIHCDRAPLIVAPLDRNGVCGVCGICGVVGVELIRPSLQSDSPRQSWPNPPSMTMSLVPFTESLLPHCPALLCCCKKRFDREKLLGLLYVVVVVVFFCLVHPPALMD